MTEKEGVEVLLASHRMWKLCRNSFEGGNVTEIGGMVQRRQVK